MKLCPKCGTEQVFNAGHNPGGMQCLQVQLHAAERERDDARARNAELDDEIGKLKEKLALHAKVIDAAREAVRMWSDGERYGGQMMELECAVLDLDEAEKGDRHESE